MRKATKRDAVAFGRAYEEHVAEIQKIAADVGVTLSRDEVVKLQALAGEERRPFAKVFRAYLERRLDTLTYPTGN